MPIPPYPQTHRPAFIACTLDRMEHWRRDAADRAHLLPEAQVIPIWRYKVPVDGEIAVSEKFSAYAERESEMTWMGIWQGRSYYCLDISSEEKPELHKGQFLDLRSAAMKLKADDAALLGYARAMMYWHRQHRYCGRCGDSTSLRQAGHVRHCAGCDTEHYPRTDPSMLVIVTAEDHCLLGRKPEWPKGMWSTLAGFVEPGESIEDAVVREVWEESRIKVTGMQYLASQAWPFPASVLMGYIAEGIKETPQVEQDELDDADWFSREDIRQMLAEKRLFLPPPITLSFQLLEYWFDLDSPQSLRELCGYTWPS